MLTIYKANVKNPDARSWQLTLVIIMWTHKVHLQTSKPLFPFSLPKFSWIPFTHNAAQNEHIVPKARNFISRYETSIFIILSHWPSVTNYNNNIARYWSKIADWNVPHLYLARNRWGDPVGILRHLWRQKTRVPGVSYCVVFVILRLAVLIQCRPVSDRQTDGRTDTRRQQVSR